MSKSRDASDMLLDGSIYPALDGGTPNARYGVVKSNFGNSIMDVASRGHYKV
jgi:hypothetical protein